MKAWVVGVTGVAVVAVLAVVAVVVLTQDDDADGGSGGRDAATAAVERFVDAVNRGVPGEGGTTLPAEDGLPPIRLLGNPLRMSATPVRAPRRPPFLDEHRDDILRRFGPA